VNDPETKAEAESLGGSRRLRADSHGNAKPKTQVMSFLPKRLPEVDVKQVE
jgi:hypothetical protein